MTHLIGVFDLFRVGLGPSSSHTVGPMRAAAAFAQSAAPLSGGIAKLRVTLMGSLAWTGRGHATDVAIYAGLAGQDPATAEPDQVFATATAAQSTGHLAIPTLGEIEIEIAFCGVCHSDIHQCAGDWENTVWPCVPGHEIVGTVREIGDDVSKFAIGDTVGVGCMVNSCQICAACTAGEEQYCSGPKSATFTYNGPKLPDGTNSYGGYSDSIIVREEFVVTIPDVIEAAHAATA